MSFSVSEAEVRTEGAVPFVLSEEVSAQGRCGRSDHLVVVLVSAQSPMSATSSRRRRRARESLLGGRGASVQRLLHVTTVRYESQELVL